MTEATSVILNLEQMTALYRRVKLVPASLDLHSKLAAIAEAFRELTQAELSSILLRDDDDRLVLRVGRGAMAGAIAQGIPASSGIVGRALRAERPVLVPDMQSSELLCVLDDEVRGQSLGELHPSGAHAAESIEWAPPDAGSINHEDRPGYLRAWALPKMSSRWRYVWIHSARAMVLCDEVHMTSGAVLLRAGERPRADHFQRIQLFYTDGVFLTTVVEVAAESLATESASPLMQRQK